MTKKDLSVLVADKMLEMENAIRATDISDGAHNAIDKEIRKRFDRALADLAAVVVYLARG